MKRSKWDQRIQRADELASAHPFAAEALRFYKGIATFQKELYAYVDAARGNGSRKKIAGSFDDSLDIPLLLPKFSELLSCVGAFSPAPVAKCAADLKARPNAESRDLLAAYWKARSDSNPTFGQPKVCSRGYFCSRTRKFSPTIANANPAGITSRFAPFVAENLWLVCFVRKETGQNDF